jgi:alpha-amylase/alpha-mannosidase (GH57 family)
MKKLRIAFLWHQHQPYYKYKDEFVLPWVRLHGVKDYYDLPEILNEFPDIKQTFNFAPSLYKQINQYVAGETKDNIQRLSYLKAYELTNEHKRDIIKHFFKCHKENMIDIHPRYKELYESSRDIDYAVVNYSNQDWLDLQVWYNLTWVGYFSSKNEFIQALLSKQRNFTEEEKLELLAHHLVLLSKIIPQMNKYVQNGQVEISVSPMYHPILPLLINSESAFESMPDTTMPSPLFKWREDAEMQIKLGLDSFEKVFKHNPLGMWPSEGSVSDETLQIIAENNIRWIATDEEILYKSKHCNYLDKYFPYTYVNNEKKLTVFFRDHSLSDKIGFEYSRREPVDAAIDFINNLTKIRQDIIDNYGEDALDKAVVPVILDGENCWEFYRENGIPFLRELFKRLSGSSIFQTFKFNELLDGEYEELSHIHAGSWINADFKIWIGDKEDIDAWNMLSKVRIAFEERKHSLDNNTLESVREHLFAAEGSDWFWWYGPEHHTEDKDTFDMIFRWHISSIYELLNEVAPDELNNSIVSKSEFQTFSFPTEIIKPSITGKLDGDDWKYAGFYNTHNKNSAMHQISSDISKILFGTDYDFLYLRIITESNLKDNDSVKVFFSDRANFNLSISRKGAEVNNFGIKPVRSFKYKYIDCIDIAVDLPSLNFFDNTKDHIELQIALKTDKSIKYYPENERLILRF